MLGACALLWRFIEWVATVGINPSDKEFVNALEIVGHKRRFHTLKSLGISCWSEADDCHIQHILESCTKYFECDRNSYDRWFKPLDKIVAGTGASFYSSDACHLDLVPYGYRQVVVSVEVPEVKAIIHE